MHEIPASRDWCCVWGIPSTRTIDRRDEAKRKVGALPQTPPGPSPWTSIPAMRVF